MFFGYTNLYTRRNFILQVPAQGKRKQQSPTHPHCCLLRSAALPLPIRARSPPEGLFFFSRADSGSALPRSPNSGEWDSRSSNSWELRVLVGRSRRRSKRGFKIGAVLVWFWGGLF
ncbi:hypothetical protein GUJ93_ZPchr0010g8504 [Zizania palustris]|uniref:Uncharacterized protein n=1 Tax=Zizania palustris TaxID=103762 RepID=A0A8J5WCY7_ZIZPA|nr:hypothetical protein GUJ93_ZPchr0010g8504 [Zizania palustris]